MRLSAPNLMIRLAALAMLALALPLVTGCSTDRLETGYQPRALKANAIQRRGYYASPFSPEARQAQVETNRDAGFQRDRPGGRF